VKTATKPTRAHAGRKSIVTRAFEKALAAQPTGRFILRLYVAGATERSRQAVVRARQVCEAELKGNFELQVIDVYQQPLLARNGQIVATPTLVREFPRPVRRLIGNLSNTIGLLVGLDLVSRGKTER
jgi:circadian clock protein KaiB